MLRHCSTDQVSTKEGELLGAGGSAEVRVPGTGKRPEHGAELKGREAVLGAQCRHRTKDTGGGRGRAGDSRVPVYRREGDYDRQDTRSSRSMGEVTIATAMATPVCLVEKTLWQLHTQTLGFVNLCSLFLGHQSSPSNPICPCPWDT